MNRALKAVLLFSSVITMSTALQAQPASKTAAPDGARVYIVSPAEGEVVATTFTVVFGLAGMGVAPAGIERENTGHHHLLVDGVAMPDMNMPLGDAVTHFGGGQTQTTLTLAPGSHTLQLILGDYLHTPHQPPVVSEKITIVVAN